MGRGLAAQDHIRQGFRWPVTLHDHLGHRLSQTFSRAAAATRGRAPITPDNWTVHIGGYSHPASD